MAKPKKSVVIVELLISDEPTHQIHNTAELQKLHQALAEGKRLVRNDASNGGGLWLVLK